MMHSQSAGRKTGKSHPALSLKVIIEGGGEKSNCAEEENREPQRRKRRSKAAKSGLRDGKKRGIYGEKPLFVNNTQKKAWDFSNKCRRNFFAADIQ
ncbi:MAG: hypothetical protein IJC58_05965 [Oscillospiraceae bacterium]|nr:hypothetical protein [Oscillospiraceae bacterium]